MRFIITLIAFHFFSINIACAREITDSLGRHVVIPDVVQRVICSGSGCLRLLTYVQGQNHVVAVDDIEIRDFQFDSRAYAIANPQYRNLPIFGEFRGRDNPELIMTLDPPPQVIFKLVGTGKGTGGADPDTLHEKTGVPVIALKYGNLTSLKSDLYKSLKIIGEVTNKESRAKAVIGSFEELMKDLKNRTQDIAQDQQPSVYLGGVAHAGPHGFQSTEPAYPPFHLLPVNNLTNSANSKAREINTSTIAKEKIVDWDPDYLFLDLSTLQLGNQAGGLYELRNDPAYQMLTAVKTGKVFGLLPYNLYNQNFESILANAFYLGKLLYPEAFIDIIPAKKADEIFTFFVGQPVFAQFETMYNEFVFQRVRVQ